VRSDALVKTDQAVSLPLRSLHLCCALRSCAAAQQQPHQGEGLPTVGGTVARSSQDTPLCIRQPHDDFHFPIPPIPSPLAPLQPMTRETHARQPIRFTTHLVLWCHHTTAGPNMQWCNLCVAGRITIASTLLTKSALCSSAAVQFCSSQHTRTHLGSVAQSYTFTELLSFLQGNQADLNTPRAARDTHIPRFCYITQY
jgi:hypothetical protein